MKTALGLVLLFGLTQAGTAFDPASRKKEYPWMSVATWTQMHEGFLKRAKEGKIDLLFLGDSITQGWGNNAVWQKHYGALNAANFGIGGDTTENVLWRIQKVNEQIMTLDDKKNVRYLDLGAKLSNPDGSLAKDVMPDFLHLSEKGYQIWAEAMDPLLKQMLGK